MKILNFFLITCVCSYFLFFFFSSRRRHTRWNCDLEFRRVLFRAQTAFWLNLYNACVLRDALELEVEGFFARERARVAGRGWSLDDIEHGLLRGNAPKPGSFSAPMKKSDPRLAYVPLTYDERMHFA